MVQHLEGGIINNIFVENGERVELRGFGVFDVKQRQAALAQYLSFSSNDINSIGVKNIQLGQFFEEGGMAKRKKSEMGMVPEAAPTKGVKRAKPLSDKEYFERQSERTRKGRASMTEQQKINMLTG